MKTKNIIIALIVIILIVAAAIYVERNTTIYTGVITYPMPEEVSEDQGRGTEEPGQTNQQKSQETVELQNYGMAPEFIQNRTWLNSQPLTLAELKGKVVLVDFWTYSCINCIRTLPYVTNWYDTYKDDGLVVVGVHTPEFVFERDTNNVRQAISRFNINYPVVQDNDYAIWSAYSNHYWPAKYIIDKNGTIVYKHFGEGEYEHTEELIRYLLGLDMAGAEAQDYAFPNVNSPEMYFGSQRMDNLARGQSASYSPKNYEIKKDLSLNEFSLGGEWKFRAEYIELTGQEGEIDLKFSSGKVYMVAESSEPANLKITVDGVQQPDVVVQDSKLYTLFDSEDYAEHFMEIKIQGQGFRAFTFTFG